MVAAATTSLPERMESIRNYDYRYAWIRDQCYTGLAVAAHGPHPLLEGAAGQPAAGLRARRHAGERGPPLPQLALSQVSGSISKHGTSKHGAGQRMASARVPPSAARPSTAQAT
jgi:hypothetical protein